MIRELVCNSSHAGPGGLIGADRATSGKCRLRRPGGAGGAFSLESESRQRRCHFRCEKIISDKIARK